MSTTRKSYHTDFKIACNFGFLSDHTYKSIPKTTRHRFKHSDYSNHIGAKEYSQIISNMYIIKRIAKLQKLVNTLKVLFKANDVIKSIYQKYTQPLHTFFNKESVRNKIIKFIKQNSNYFDISKLAKLFNISAHTFYKWIKKECYSSPFKKCYQRHPFQLTLKESNKIKQMLLDPNFKHWPIVSIAHYAIKNSIIFVRPRTWYKYAKIFGLTRPRPKNRRKKNKTGIRASKPNQIIHADVTILVILHTIKASF